jgi:hypothetical protein
MAEPGARDVQMGRAMRFDVARLYEADASGRSRSGIRARQGSRSEGIARQRGQVRLG